MSVVSWSDVKIHFPDLLGTQQLIYAAIIVGAVEIHELLAVRTFQ